MFFFGLGYIVKARILVPGAQEVDSVCQDCLPDFGVCGLIGEPVDVGHEMAVEAQAFFKALDLSAYNALVVMEGIDKPVLCVLS